MGISSQVGRLAGVDQDITIGLTVHEQDVVDQPDTDEDWQIQYARVSINYNTFAGVGDGSLQDAGGTIGGHFTVGFGYEREEVVAEIVGGGSEAGENYVRQNAGTHETSDGFSTWAGHHRSAIANVFQSDQYDDNIPDDASVVISGQTWDASRIRQFRSEHSDESGITMGRDFFTLTSIMYQLERTSQGLPSTN
jgi:hypothetical protein